MIKCPSCNHNPAPIHPTYGVIWCDECNKKRDKTPLGGYPEFTTENIKTERKKYLKSMLQSHRDGELSKEWVKAYPDRAKGMVESGNLTKKEVKNAKNVWPELSGWEKTQ